MLLNEEFQVKINDFGFSTDQVGTLDTILGTPEYEAPELALERVYDGPKVDVFAAGVSLFNMFTGKPPFKVANYKKPKEYPFYNLIATRNNNYWKEFSEKYWCIKNPDEKGLFTKEFKSLIFGILEPNPDKRLTIDEIRKHAWMKGPTATPEEMEREFRKRHGPMRYTRKQQEVEKLREYEFKPFNYRKKKLAQKKE